MLSKGSNGEEQGRLLPKIYKDTSLVKYKPNKTFSHLGGTVDEIRLVIMKILDHRTCTYVNIGILASMSKCQFTIVS